MENVKKTETIITEDGLFYSNFSDRFKLALATIPDSENYSEYLVWLRETYGIKVGKPMPYSNGQLPSDSRVVGIYIVDYQKYLSDLNSGLTQSRNEGHKR